MEWDETPTESEREMMHLFDTEEDKFKISGDIASELLKYFIDEY